MEWIHARRNRNSASNLLEVGKSIGRLHQGEPSKIQQEGAEYYREVDMVIDLHTTELEFFVVW